MNEISLRRLFSSSAAAAALFTILLTTKSVIDFTRTGPSIREQIEAHYLGYAAWSVTRLSLAAFIIAWSLGLAGSVVQSAFLPVQRRPWVAAFLASGIGIAIGTAQQFAALLIYEPSTLVASWLYDVGRLVNAWFWIDPDWLPYLRLGLALLVTSAIFKLAWQLVRANRALSATFVAGIPMLSLFLLWMLEKPPIFDSSKAVKAASNLSQPNIVMIGADTLRADRFGIEGYSRRVTPYIDTLAQHGYWFSQTYVPIARTAPSITTLLTGAWPRHHGITVNFVPHTAFHLPVPTLPNLLRQNGYRTAAVGDWAAGDLGKFDFGFDEAKTAPDQWNLKYLLRQGPKDLRLFLSLFTHNELGRILLPELYYLAGRPLTTDIGRQSRLMIDRLAQDEQPFFLMVFIATTHLPFGSDYPYYTLFSGSKYQGKSKFSMTGVFTPEEIAKRQSEGSDSFDVQQIIDLYDGAVRQFDDEVGRIVQHLKKRGLADNTIIVVFSDHGTDLFEHSTWGQGNTVIGNDPSNRIPLLIVDPRRKGNGLIKSIVRSLDVAPTLLELAGLESKSLQADGTSLVPYMDGETTKPLAAYYATGAWLARVQGIAKDHLRVPPLLELLEIPDYGTGTIAMSEKGMRLIEAARDRAIRFESWKLVRIPTISGARYSLYDTRHSEVTNIIDNHPKVANFLKNALEQWATSPATQTSVEKLTDIRKIDLKSTTHQY